VKRVRPRRKEREARGRRKGNSRDERRTTPRPTLFFLSSPPQFVSHLAVGALPNLLQLLIGVHGGRERKEEEAKRKRRKRERERTRTREKEKERNAALCDFD
jgi:hypothetical protein